MGQAVPIPRWTAAAIAAALVAAPAAGAPDSERNANLERPNVIGVEAGGRGGIASLQYERWLTERLGIGFGFSAIPCVECGTGPNGEAQGYMLWILPAWCSFAVPVNAMGSIVLSAGATFALPGAPNEAAAVVPSVGFAYQLHLDAGFVLRPGLLLFVAPTRTSTSGWRTDAPTFFPWGGVEFGWSF